MKITEKIVNVETGEETFVDRNETTQEAAERKAYESKLVEEQVEAEAKQAQRQAIFDRLGLTADEAKILLG